MKSNNIVDSVVKHTYTTNCTNEEERIKKEKEYKEQLNRVENDYIRYKTKYFFKNVELLKMFNVFSKKRKNKSQYDKVSKRNRIHMYDFLKLDFSNIKYVFPYLIDKPNISFDYYVARQHPTIRRMMSLIERMNNVM